MIQFRYRLIVLGLIVACLVLPISDASAQDGDDVPNAILSALQQTNGFVELADPAADTQARQQRDLLQQARDREAFARRRAEAMASGACDAPDTTELVELCLKKDTNYALNAVAIPRQAAPFQVQIVFSDQITRSESFARQRPELEFWEKRHICGGSLIAKNWVLTAAHCFQTDNPAHYALRLDVGNIAEDHAKTVPVTQLILHEDYDPGTFANDLALLRFDDSELSINLSAGLGPDHAVGWDFAERQPLRDVTIYDRNILLLHRADRSIEFLDVRTGERPVTLGPQDTKLDLRYWSGRSYLILPRGNMVELIRGVSGQGLRIPHRENVSAADFDPDTSRLAVAGESGVIQLQWVGLGAAPIVFNAELEPAHIDLLADDQLRLTGLDGREEIWRVQPGRDAKRVSVQSSVIPPPFELRSLDTMDRFLINAEINGVIRHYRTIHHRLGLQLSETAGLITLHSHKQTEPVEIGRTELRNPRMGLDPDERRLIAIGESGQGEIWNVRRGRVDRRFEVETGFYDSPIQFLDDGDQFLIWNSDGLSEIRNARTGRLIQRFNHSLPINGVTEMSADRLVVSTEFGTAEVWNAKTGNALARVYHGGTVNGTDLHEDRFLTWNYEGRIRLWDVSGGAEIYHHLLGLGRDDSSAINPQGLDMARVGVIGLSNQVPGPDFPDLVKAFGWGKIQTRPDQPASARLRMLSLTPIDWPNCISASQLMNANAVDPKAFCVMGQGRKTCRGDSGGPVIGDDALVGVVSRGSGFCKIDGEPSTFVTVAEYDDWIRKHTCLPVSATSQMAEDWSVQPSICWNQPQ